MWDTTPDFSFYKNYTNISITVIIPFYNEEKIIRKLVQSLLQQSLEKGRWEVLFINDNSTDKSMEIINRLCENRLKYRIINNDGCGKKAAVTTGINRVEEGLIITTDADCSFSSKWLKTIVAQNV